MVPVRARRADARNRSSASNRRADARQPIHIRVRRALILEELIASSGAREGWFRFRLIPQGLAFAYYQVSWLLYVLRPAWSYRLNADFEDHAEHEYMTFVGEHPEWAALPYVSAFGDQYAELASVADLFRQIAYDERQHKEESLARMRTPRFR